METFDSCLASGPFFEEVLVIGQVYAMSELKRIEWNGGNLCCYMATVDGARRFNMLTPISEIIDRIVRDLALNENEAFRLELKMQATKHCASPDEDEMSEGVQLGVGDNSKSRESDDAKTGENSDSDRININIWVSDEPAEYYLPSTSATSDNMTSTSGFN